MLFEKLKLNKKALEALKYLLNINKNVTKTKSTLKLIEIK